ncbi:hypothetical protein ACFQ1I_42785 [Kitasatospora arboriphila]
MRHEVELLRDGRGYSTRQVRAYQNGLAGLRLPGELRGQRARRQLRGPDLDLEVPPRPCPTPRRTWRSAAAAP